MTVQITVPGMGKNLKTKDMILSILAREHPLTAKQITNQIKKQFGASVTFQAVYNAINQLAEDRILTKDGTAVELSKAWIMQAKAFLDQLQSEYFEERESVTDALVGEDIKVYYFDDLVSLDKFWNGVLEQWFSDPDLKDEKLTQQSGHAWYVLGQLEEEARILSRIKEKKLAFYTLSDGDTPLDRWAEQYYRKEGFHYATNKKKGKQLHNHYFIIYADHIMESVYPEDLGKELDDIYASAKSLNELDPSAFIRILRRKTKLKITIMRNAPLAKRLREEILRNWK